MLVSFEVNSLLTKMVLNLFPYSFQGPDDQSLDMESVSNDGCTRKHGLHYTAEKRRQVHYDEFHLHTFFTWKPAKVMNHFHAIPIRQDIQYFVSLRAIDRYLIPLSTGISPKLIEGQDFRKMFWGTGM